MCNHLLGRVQWHVQIDDTVVNHASGKVAADGKSQRVVTNYCMSSKATEDQGKLCFTRAVAISLFLRQGSLRTYIKRNRPFRKSFATNG